MRKYTTIYSHKEDTGLGDGDVGYGIDFHIDHIHTTDEMHFVHYDPKRGHDLDGYMLSRGEAIKAARAILAHFKVDEGAT